MERIKVTKISDMYLIELFYDNVKIFADYFLARNNCDAAGRAFSIAAGHNFTKPAYSFNV